MIPLSSSDPSVTLERNRIAVVWPRTVAVSSVPESAPLA
jgi:hypothetical protein